MNTYSFRFTDGTKVSRSRKVKAANLTDLFWKIDEFDDPFMAVIKLVRPGQDMRKTPFLKPRWPSYDKLVGAL